MKTGSIVVPLMVSLFLLCTSCSTVDLPDRGVAVLSPKANDLVPGGTSCEVQWKEEISDPEFGAVVMIEFSKNAGKSWEQIEENVPKDGKFLWKVPNIDSPQCKIRISSQRRPEYRGTSGVFAVKKGA